MSLDLRKLYLKDLTLLGCTAQTRESFGRLVHYIESGEIKPLVAKVYPLREIVQAQAEFMTRRHIGKIVVTLAA